MAVLEVNFPPALKQWLLGTAINVTQKYYYPNSGFVSTRLPIAFYSYIPDLIPNKIPKDKTAVEIIFEKVVAMLPLRSNLRTALMAETEIVGKYAVLERYRKNPSLNAEILAIMNFDKNVVVSSGSITAHTIPENLENIKIDKKDTIKIVFSDALKGDEQLWYRMYPEVALTTPMINKIVDAHVVEIKPKDSFKANANYTLIISRATEFVDDKKLQQDLVFSIHTKPDDPEKPKASGFFTPTPIPEVAPPLSTEERHENAAAQIEKNKEISPELQVKIDQSAEIKKQREQAQMARLQAATDKGLIDQATEIHPIPKVEAPKSNQKRLSNGKQVFMNETAIARANQSLRQVAITPGKMFEIPAETLPFTSRASYMAGKTGKFISHTGMANLARNATSGAQILARKGIAKAGGAIAKMAAGKAIGGTIGGALGSVAPGVGNVIGAVAGSVIGDVAIKGVGIVAKYGFILLIGGIIAIPIFMSMFMQILQTQPLVSDFLKVVKIANKASDLLTRFQNILNGPGSYLEKAVSINLLIGRSQLDAAKNALKIAPVLIENIPNEAKLKKILDILGYDPDLNKFASTTISDSQVLGVASSQHVGCVLKLISVANTPKISVILPTIDNTNLTWTNLQNSSFTSHDDKHVYLFETNIPAKISTSPKSGDTLYSLDEQQLSKLNLQFSSDGVKIDLDQTTLCAQ